MKKWIGLEIVFIALLVVGCVKQPKKDLRVPGKVILCGVCKDVERAVPYSIENLETLGNLFDDYRVFIYENNSKDKTPQLLQEWAQNNDRVTVTSEVVDDEILSKTCFNVTIQNEFYRPERIARARNIVLDQAMRPDLDDFAYVIWIDLDFEHPFPFEEIVKTFQSPVEWDAVFANGVNDKGLFYDSYSLRDNRLPFGAELIGDQWWHIRGKIHLKLEEENGWYPVYSAFGGMGIYKREAIKGCRYSANVTKDVETLAKRFICGLEWQDHPEVQIYHKELAERTGIFHLPLQPIKEMPKRTQQEGFILGDDPEGLVFRMNSGVAQYPSICEHVPFHASMILHGHNKLYVNPSLVLYYFGRS